MLGFRMQSGDFFALFVVIVRIFNHVRASALLFSSIYAAAILYPFACTASSICINASVLKISIFNIDNTYSSGNSIAISFAFLSQKLIQQIISIFFVLTVVIFMPAAEKI